MYIEVNKWAIKINYKAHLKLLDESRGNTKAVHDISDLSYGLDLTYGGLLDQCFGWTAFHGWVT